MTKKSKGVPNLHNTRIGSGALGNTTDKLKVRKAPGHIAKKEMIPHIRGNC